MYTTRITRTLEENPGARKVRTAVFMEEQGYKNEFDDHDADAVHLCIYDGEEGIATARSYQKPDGVWEAPCFLLQGQEIGASVRHACLLTFYDHG